MVKTEMGKPTLCQNTEVSFLFLINIQRLSTLIKKEGIKSNTYDSGQCHGMLE